MEDVIELIKACEKFKNGRFGVDDLSRMLSQIAVPDELKSLVSNAEYSLERIRFLVSDSEQYPEVMKIVNEILEKATKLLP
ncbi:hypothetical protein AM501_11095 [Aneurinibacillus migulanus]|uniref:hypothetical protein n=1 Tax=Aneurinibacillus migulanus TaxID=47500 RepID=UPI0005BE0D6A|nr:hypothetical protein [Aneurinibacillus migulanus]KIV51599.1 hypothetical protein TS64_22810 [Aneurinibacillus migulanus]KPD08270.1 hypothetical protein AM501_11095 [Aneurinibacillus migulanus]